MLKFCIEIYSAGFVYVLLQSYFTYENFSPVVFQAMSVKIILLLTFEVSEVLLRVKFSLTVRHWLIGPIENVVV